MTRKYYYLVDATDTYAVSSIAKGGSIYNKPFR